MNLNLADIVDLASSTAASLARLGSGAYVRHVGERPVKLLELYEREACPFSRKVREALSILDLDAVVHPCPEGGRRFATRVEERLGKLQIPFLVDANAGVELSDSDEIVRHLFTRYGDGAVPLALRNPTITNAMSKLASRLRGEKGSHAEPSKDPAELLELWSFEASPQARIVREVLSELEIPYVLHNVAPGSAKRTEGVVVPMLRDKTHDLELANVHDIVAHLRSRYGVARAA